MVLLARLTSAGTASAIDACPPMAAYVRTPRRWSLKPHHSRGLLRPITRIASACGFSSAVTFRQNFAAAFSTTPTSYRRRFAPTPA